MNAPIVTPIPRSLSRKAGEAIRRRPDLQAAWLAVMDGQGCSPLAAATAHLSAMTPERRAELERGWL